MATNHAYQYSVVDMKTVCDDIDEYIIPENQEACKLLWSKNIFTLMCNNYDNEDSWITLSCLSEENKKLFDELALKDKRFGRTWGGIGFKIPIKPGKGNDTYEAFKELIDLFPMQDVQKDGYMTVDEYLMNYTNCYKMVPNPNFRPLQKPRPSEYEDPVLYSKAFFAYVDSVSLPREIRVVDESKMEKTLEEYLSASKFAGLYDQDDGKIFYNKMYYNAHLRYKEINNVHSFK